MVPIPTGRAKIRLREKDPQKISRGTIQTRNFPAEHEIAQRNPATVVGKGPWERQLNRPNPSIFSLASYWSMTAWDDSGLCRGARSTICNHDSLWLKPTPNSYPWHRNCSSSYDMTQGLVTAHLQLRTIHSFLLLRAKDPHPASSSLLVDIHRDGRSEVLILPGTSKYIIIQY